jgi:hypothetical protein
MPKNRQAQHDRSSPRYWNANANRKTQVTGSGRGVAKRETRDLHERRVSAEQTFNWELYAKGMTWKQFMVSCGHVPGNNQRYRDAIANA